MRPLRTPRRSRRAALGAALVLLLLVAPPALAHPQPPRAPNTPGSPPAGHRSATFAPARPAFSSPTAWTNRTAGVEPSPRWGAMAAYDAADGYLVVFGGIGNSHGALRDTWTWANGKWTDRT